MKKIILLLFVLLFYTSINVYASSISVKDTDMDMYFYLKDGGIINKGKYYIFQDSTSKDELYSLDPTKSLYFKKEFQTISENQWNYLNISENDWDRITKILHFGYGYKNHNDKNWFQATNYMIHQVINKHDIFLTSSFSLEDKLDFSEYINEIEYLIENGDVMPSFINSSLEYKVNEDIKLCDENMVLDDYDVLDDTVLDVSIKDNSLFISKIDNPGEYTIFLKKGENKPYNVYYYKDCNLYQSFVDMNGDFEEIIELKFIINPTVEESNLDEDIIPDITPENSNIADVTNIESEETTEEQNILDIIKDDSSIEELKPIINKEIVEQDNFAIDIKENATQNNDENLIENNLDKYQDDNILVNPKTGDNIIVFGVILAISCIILIKKWLKMH